MQYLSCTVSLACWLVNAYICELHNVLSGCVVGMSTFMTYDLQHAANAVL